MPKRKMQQRKAEEVEEAEEEEVKKEESDGGGDDEDDSGKEEEEEEGKDVNEDSEGDDDSDGGMRDYRKRLKPKRGRKASAGEDDGEGGSAAQAFESDGTYRNKQRVLVFCSRGITSRYRHLMDDLRQLLPHSKKDVKLDVGRSESLSSAVNSICEMKTCNNCIFLECRKKQDLYMWVGKAPHGPSAKFHVLNVHTMDELKLTGNCMKGSRPLLSFDATFNTLPQWQVLQKIFTDAFGTPRGHPKSKPFIDRVMGFYVADDKIWVRNYQIVDASDSSVSGKRMEKAGEEAVSLVEIGPRLVLCPIRIFAGSFGGATLFSNAAYVSPNFARAEKKGEAGLKYGNRVAAKADFQKKKEEVRVPLDPLGGVFKM